MGIQELADDHEASSAIRGIILSTLGIGGLRYCVTMRNLWTPAKPDRRSSGEDDLQNYAGNAQMKTVGQNITIAVMLTNRMPVIRKSLLPVWKKWTKRKTTGSLKSVALYGYIRD